MKPLRSTGRGASSRRLAVVLACAAPALVSCSSGSSNTNEPRFGAGTPVVGACRVLTAADVAPTSNNTPTVPCSSPHTAVTIAVGGFPAADVTDAALTSGRLGNEALQRCTTAWRHTVGGSVEAQHTTVLALAYYLPDPDQLSQGARRYRCDLIMGGEDGMPLVDLPKQVDGLLDGDVTDAYRACRTAPNFDDGHQVACSSPHTLRAIGIAPLPDKATYPGGDVLKAESANGCRSVVRQWLHGRVGGGTSYQWPDQVSWNVLHDRSATCWAVTTS